VVLHAHPGWRASHFRTATGVELDLVLEEGRRRLAFEFKASSAPAPTRGFHQAISDVEPEHTFIVAPVDQSYPIADAVTVCPPGDLIEKESLPDQDSERRIPLRSFVLPKRDGSRRFRTEMSWHRRICAFMKP